MLKFCLPVWSLIFLLSMPVPVHADAGKAEKEERELNLHAQSAVLMDADTGRILYAKDEKTRRPMASTTKIMTCILALEQGNLEDPVKISSYAASMPEVRLHVRTGEQYRLEDLLYSLMLESHNDSAAAIAEHIGGSIEGFAELMNQKARDIGCLNTCFVTPNGLDGNRKSDQTPHSTTAEDLARVMRYCVTCSAKKDEFLKITRTQSRTITDLSGKRSFYLGNHNAFLSMTPEAWSGKTGFTGKAGYCYIGAVRKDGKVLIASLLGCGWPPHKTYKWEDMRKLASYGFKNYEYYEIFDKNKQFPLLNVKNGKRKTVPMTMNLDETDQTLKVLMKKGERPSVRYEYPKEIKAPVRKGAIVGTASYYIGQTLISAYPIYAAESADKIDFKWCVDACLKQYFLFGRN